MKISEVPFKRFMRKTEDGILAGCITNKRKKTISISIVRQQTYCLSLASIFSLCWAGTYLLSGAQ
jgi:hypothetical protein